LNMKKTKKIMYGAVLNRNSTGKKYQPSMIFSGYFPNGLQPVLFYLK